MPVTDVPTWVGIALCLTQSAMFSGLNLAFFSVSRLRLEAEVAAGNKRAQIVLRKRADANFLLATILWGNVGINVLLTLLSDSVMAGVAAFLFSTIAITFLGEIIPQAYFARHALNMASRLAPVISFYQILLFPVAKPVAMLLDLFLGKEGITYFRENDLREIIKKHIEAEGTEIDAIEGRGALNFLDIDDLDVSEEGERVDPESVVALDVNAGQVTFPTFTATPDDPFLQQIHRSGKKWVVFTDRAGQPQLALDADGFLRAMLFGGAAVNIRAFCHRPLVVSKELPLGKAIAQLNPSTKLRHDDIIENDILLVWGNTRLIVTGADILGRLLRGIQA